MAENQEFIQVEEEGARYKTSFTAKYRKRKVWEEHNPKRIVSLIPGTMLEVLVAPGQKVAMGQPVIKFVAMKMHNTIIAPAEGIVKTVNVQAGENFKKMQLLLELA